MISGYLMNARVQIVRRGTYTPPGSPPPVTYDAWNAPSYGEDAVVGTVSGRIRPLTIAEQRQLSDDAPTTAEYRAYLPPDTDVRIGDRLRKLTGETYEVRGVTPDPAGTDRYVFAELARVTV